MSHRSGLSCFAGLGDAAEGEIRSGDAGTERNGAVDRIRTRKSVAALPESRLIVLVYSSGIRTLSGEAGPESDYRMKQGGGKETYMAQNWPAAPVVASGEVFFNGKKAICVQASHAEVTLSVRCAKRQCVV